MKDETYQQKLEKLIHRELEKLPDQEAPASLVPGVMAALESAARKPWWHRPWSAWPPRMQNAFLTFLALYTGGITWEAAAAWSRLPEPGAASWINVGPLVAIWEGCSVLGSAVLLVLGNISPLGIYALITVGISVYLACVVFGLAWYQVAFSRSFRQPRV